MGTNSASTIVSEAIRLDSLRCSKVICKNGGHVIYRNLDPSVRWEVLYHRAILIPEEYEVEYDKAIASEVDGDGQITWVRADLKNKSMPELRKIGAGLSVTGRSIEDIIDNIIKAQARNAKAKADLEK